MCLNNLQATLLPDEALGNMQADNMSYFFQKEGYVGRDNGQNLTFVILV